MFTHTGVCTVAVCMEGKKPRLLQLLGASIHSNRWYSTIEGMGAKVPLRAWHLAQLCA